MTLNILAKCTAILIILMIILIIIDIIDIGNVKNEPFISRPVDIINECDSDNFDNFDNVKGTKSGCYLVPNYVHFLRFGLEKINFVESVCILAALKNQKPDKIFIHSDTPTFKGKYWSLLLNTTGFKEKLVIKYVKLPHEIYGQILNLKWRKYHGGDITRLKILMKYGGIFLDNDSFVIRSLNDLRRFEMTLGWMENHGLSNQVIIAHKNARFLKRWLESYKDYYPTEWYYNAGIKPTNDILRLHPELVHREKFLLANHFVIRKLFMENWTDWRTHYAVHLLINHQYLLKNVSSIATYPVQFDEVNINNYPVTFRDMVYDVYPMAKQR